MKADPALPRYQEKVARERQRIQQYMLTVSMDERKAFSQTRTTRRIVFDKHTELLAWDVTSRKVLYRLDVLRGSFDFREGVTASLVILSPDGIVTRTLNVGRDPVYLGGDVFVSVDSVEPFVYGESGNASVRLIVYSGAGPKGLWAEGTVVGTEEERNYK